MPKYLYFLVFLVVSTTVCFSQERPNYKLLWEVTKRDEPSLKSYVFGTMHVQDERVFKFSDSVIPAIQNTDVFALEIDPTIVGDAVSEKLLEVKGDTNIYKEILSEEEYTRLSDKFYEINGYSFEDFSLSHPMMIESMLTPSIKKKNDKRTFLDVHLYGVANYFDREITGLEDVEDQFPEIDAIPKEELREAILELLDLDAEIAEKYHERLVEIYYSGSIEKMYYLMNGLYPIDAVMKKRNQKMVKSFDSIMQHKTIFAAVGAAHLPGNDGVLDLLKKKGYTVKAVPPTFNDPEFQYELIPKMETWKTNTYKEAGYGVQTPKMVVEVPIGPGIQSYTVADLYSGSSFNYFHIDYGKTGQPNNEEVIDKVIENQLVDEDSELIERSKIEHLGVQGTEVVLQVKGTYIRAQYFNRDAVLYAFLVESKFNEVRSKYSDAFFNSVQFFTVEKPVAVWKKREDVQGAYSVNIKGEVSDLSRITPSPENPAIEYEIYLYASRDEENKTLGLVRYNDQPLGYYINDMSVFDAQVKNILNSRGEVLGESQPITRDGIEGKVYDVLFSSNLNARAEVYFRGNRLYMILAQKLTPEEKISAEDPFMSSFKFEPYKELKLDSLVTLNESFQVKLPQRATKTEDVQFESYEAYEYNEGFNATDLVTGGSYLVQYIKVKPYTKAASLEKFYDDYSQQLLEYNDTIISSKNSMIGGLPSRQIIMHNKNTHVRQKMELLLDGQDLILLLAYVGDEELDRVDAYFKTFKKINNKATFKLSESKMDLIATHLRSGDSLQFEAAKGAFNYYEFDKKDEKTLAKLLKYSYPDDGEEYNVKNSIVNAIVSLEGAKAVKILSSFYKSGKAPNSTKVEILRILPSLETDKAYKTFFELLEKEAPLREKGASYGVFNGLNNRPKVVLDHIEQLNTFLAQDTYRDKILDTYTYIQRYDSIHGPKLNAYKKTMLSYFEEDARRYTDTLERKKSRHLTYGLISDYLYLVTTEETLTTGVRNALLTLANDVSTNSWLNIRALRMSIENNIEIAKSALTKRLEDKYSRFEVMETLLENNQKERIPESYFEKVNFAELSLYNHIGIDYDEYYPKQINYLGAFTHEDTPYLVFTFMYDEEDGAYLGVVEDQEIIFESFKQHTVHVNWNAYDIESDWQEEAIKILKEE